MLLEGTSPRCVCGWGGGAGGAVLLYPEIAYVIWNEYYL